MKHENKDQNFKFWVDHFHKSIDRTNVPSMEYFSISNEFVMSNIVLAKLEQDSAADGCRYLLQISV